MTMRVKDVSEVLEARAKLVVSRGFTTEYQKEQEQSENCVTQPELAPPTYDKYNRVAYNWVLFKLSRKEPGDLSACDYFINFTSYWERTIVRKLDKTVKDDVLNWGREPGTIKRWVIIEPKFLKGWRL
ncbi:hypothetical protein N7449_009222 [Penicillium cf. viridicatum]|uniref:Uncharacterized protein n=1 Tax=Penicillium cf. viridicatum TaxID=2972119 RepID=A0A9W9JDR7_9EURO|nr:hypothetical protein N7449_009222 [Penicillium cf. viridicatum]